MVGRACRVEPFDLDRHGDELFAACAVDDGRMWTYLAYGPFATVEDLRTTLAGYSGGPTPLYQSFAIVEPTGGRTVGMASYLRHEPDHGVIEVGGLAFSPALQRTVAATEAMSLMMATAFELGYRRYEWKCDSLNAPSIAAAIRLGFQAEGTFRQAIVTKARSRDTSWFSILDHQWPALRAAHTRWLDPDNFDGDGRQRLRLSVLTAEARGTLGR